MLIVAQGGIAVRKVIDSKALAKVSALNLSDMVSFGLDSVYFQEIYTILHTSFTNDFLDPCTSSC